MTLTELVLKYAADMPYLEFCVCAGTYEWPKGQSNPNFKVWVSVRHPGPNETVRTLAQTVSGRDALEIAGDPMLWQLESCLEDLREQEFGKK